MVLEPLACDQLLSLMHRHYPDDPFSGRPFVCRVDSSKRSFLLYSIGSDQKDDSGTHVETFLESGDHVFWPPVPGEKRNLD
jgi:hypothetical protein